jgi:hypothetical protein
MTTPYLLEVVVQRHTPEGPTQITDAWDRVISHGLTRNAFTLVNRAEDGSETTVTIIEPILRYAVVTKP